MKRLTILCSLLFILAGSCKKDKIETDQHMPGDVQNGWQVFTATNSKLPDNQVNAISITQDDVKWIGTANGLVRIVGEVWTVFNSSNSGLPSSFIQALAVQPNGTVWVGTNKGLAKYDGVTWKTYTTSNSLLPEDPIMSITHDARHSITWIGTSLGLVSIDNTKDEWMFFDDTRDDLPLSLTTDASGALWCGLFNHFQFQGRIRRFYKGQWTSYKLNDYGYTSAFPYAMAIDKNDNVIALLTGTAVSVVIKLDGNNFVEIPKPDKVTAIRSLLLDDTKIWVGGSQLSQFSGVASQVLTLPVANPMIYALARDKAGRKWAGTISEGLAVYTE
jgi:ligand-binding sensor domain-containing protein